MPAKRKRQVGPPCACRECGKTFSPDITTASKYCSKDCSWAAQRRKAKESLPPREEMLRLHHDEGLSVEALGRYYGKSAWWAKKALASLGIENLGRPTGRNLSCVVCGTEFYARPSEIKGGRRYCSKPCQGKGEGAPSKRPGAAEKISRSKMGARNAQFKDGMSEDTIRRRHFSIGLKGESCCRVCGAVGLLHLHHVIPRSMFRGGIKELRNGIPLCPRCHHGWHHRKVTVHRDVFTPEEWAYLTSVQLLGQDVGAWLDDRYPPRPALEHAA